MQELLQLLLAIPFTAPLLVRRGTHRTSMGHRGLVSVEAELHNLVTVCTHVQLSLQACSYGEVGGCGAERAAEETVRE